MTRYILYLLILSFFTAGSACASEEQKTLHKARPKIGLVLGGGGARGLAHVGVIKALEDNHIPIAVITGTSMGAIVGSLYASGYTSNEIVKVVNKLDWNDIFNDKTSRSRATFRNKSDEFGFLTDYKITFRDGKIVLPQGIIQGQNLFLELSRLLSDTRGIGKFEELPIPFRLVATDLSTGKAVIMTDGDLASAVFASMAIPGFLPPVHREGKLLIDGGIANNVPINLARQLGADIVIVVNVGTLPKKSEDIGNFIDVLRQTQLILTQSTTNYQLSTMTGKDVLIAPDLGGLGATSFDQSKTLIKMGEKAGLSVLSKLNEYKLDDQEWARYLQSRQRGFTRTPVIDAIEVSQNSKLSDQIIRTAVRLKPGDTLNFDKLNKDIDTLYGMGLFDKITYEIDEKDDKNILQITANAKETSDGYYKFGVSLDSNLENVSTFKLGISYTKPQINRWGGEWRTELHIGDTLEGKSEVYQPLGAKQRFFVEPSLLFTRNKNQFFDDGYVLRGEVKFLTYGASLQGGMLFGRWGELRAGLTKERVKISFTDNNLSANSIVYDDTSGSVRFIVDTLDSLYFPTEGSIIIATYKIHDTFLGGELQYNQLDLNAYSPMTFGKHTFGLGTRMSGSFGQKSTFIGKSKLGGFLSLAGFSQDELNGNVAVMAMGTYYYRLNKEAPIFDTPLFLGGSLEVGNVYNSFDKISLGKAIFAGSIFAGTKTPIGPIFVGIGANDKGNTALYFSIGSFF
ncbi:MAG: patatin-like phospholipase family protein [Robiginitomaculum sp.]